MSNDTVTNPGDTSGTEPLAVASAGDTSIALAAESRTMTGRVLPFGEPGRTSAGELVFPAGSISIPTDVSRVKLLAGHSPAGVPVGVATSWEAREDGLYMTFQLGTSAAADQAIADAADGVIDSFSIEAMGIAKRGRTVERSLLKAVALVPFPAFANARVAAVHAEDSTPDTDSRQQGRQSEPGAPDPTPDADDPPAIPVVPAPTDVGEDTDPTPDPDADPDAEDTDPTPATPPTETKESDTMNRPAVVPAGLAPTPTEAHASLADVLDYIHAAREGDPTEAHAALTDITSSGMVSAVAPAWLGELWGGVEYTRRIVPLLASKPLTAMKATGYRWTTKPGVAKYAGDKTDIPSKPAAVEPVEVAAQRWAGGNDIDRKFWDFNETEILAAYWRAMAESYAMETDHDAAAFLAANATPIATPAPDLIRGIARAGLAVFNETEAAATFALVNPLDIETVLDFAELDAPKFMDIVPVADPSKWTPSAQVPQGTAIVGTKSAVDFYELAGSPIRVEAEHIAKGGRDAALFGYTAMLLAKPGGVQSITIGEPGA